MWLLGRQKLGLIDSALPFTCHHWLFIPPRPIDENICKPFAKSRHAMPFSFLDLFGGHGKRPETPNICVKRVYKSIANSIFVIRAWVTVVHPINQILWKRAWLPLSPSLSEGAWEPIMHSGPKVRGIWAESVGVLFCTLEEGILLSSYGVAKQKKMV